MLGPAARAHLHQALAGRVQGAASLVKQQQAGVACEGPCDAHALLLAPAQGNATCIPQLQHRGSRCTAALLARVGAAEMLCRLTTSMEPGGCEVKWCQLAYAAGLLCQGGMQQSWAG